MSSRRRGDWSPTPLWPAEAMKYVPPGGLWPQVVGLIGMIVILASAWPAIMAGMPRNLLFFIPLVVMGAVCVRQWFFTMVHRVDLVDDRLVIHFAFRHRVIDIADIGAVEPDGTRQFARIRLRDGWSFAVQRRYGFAAFVGDLEERNPAISIDRYRLDPVLDRRIASSKYTPLTPTERREAEERIAAASPPTTKLGNQASEGNPHGS